MYGRHLDWWKEELGAYYLDDLTSDQVEESYRKLLREPGDTGRKRTSATANRYLITLSACFSYGRKRLRWTDRNPVADVERERESKGRVRFLSRAGRWRGLRAGQAPQGLQGEPQPGSLRPGNARPLDGMSGGDLIKIGKRA
jgi:hypothetical protein